MDEIRKQLASLMETVDADESQEDALLDPKLCVYYLCGLCPHDLFQNTKQYLGPCSNLHSLPLQEKYLEQRKRSNYGFEQASYDYTKKIVDECDRRIQRHTARGRCDTQDKASESIEASAQKLIEELESQIKNKLEQAETLGNTGDIDGCIKVMEEVQELQKKKKMIQDEKNSKVEETRGMWFQKLKPCEVCGALLSERESDAARLKDHYTGRIHIGFQKMRAHLNELQEYMQCIAPLLPKVQRQAGNKSHSHASVVSRYQPKSRSKSTKAQRDMSPTASVESSSQAKKSSRSSRKQYENSPKADHSRTKNSSSPEIKEEFSADDTSAKKKKKHHSYDREEGHSSPVQKRYRDRSSHSPRQRRAHDENSRHYNHSPPSYNSKYRSRRYDDRSPHSTYHRHYSYRNRRYPVSRRSDASLMRYSQRSISRESYPSQKKHKSSVEKQNHSDAQGLTTRESSKTSEGHSSRKHSQENHLDSVYNESQNAKAKLVETEEGEIVDFKV